ncbi:hypothetical protein J3E71DRAFT_341875 [Bipolaris maydis]|nr:hypothetical protein J3E71DRAFT_341875 [Bipolaris maydis]
MSYPPRLLLWSPIRAHVAPEPRSIALACWGRTVEIYACTWVMFVANRQVGLPAALSALPYLASLKAVFQFLNNGTLPLVVITLQRPVTTLDLCSARSDSALPHWSTPKDVYFRPTASIFRHISVPWLRLRDL